MSETIPLQHYFELFCPETREVHARCATLNDAVESAKIYAKDDGRKYLVYECRVVAEIDLKAEQPDHAKAL